MPETSKFTTWRKSTRSGGASNCVEVAFTDDDAAGVRDSKDSGGPHLEFPRDDWTSFVISLRDWPL
ncbi:hypothetical protein Lfu02_79690 [Longispora fulva]|uniref:DUF397 domain-containing protein n=1 Tax=Longispora fulva TaxID=619741 RepID=A0A8J7GAV0_9ACTN|nr:DUF397 domain-containing protein [Longispora fulva]MBG6133976.1 hypothetical protein [Longispora fulva]GIG63597.1 hypothetical protein Lfu02_79690 [Longispora fulva]